MDIRYVSYGELSVGYAIAGSGDQDIVLVSNGISDIESIMEVPVLRNVHDAVSATGRVIRFDQIGCGHSDRDTNGTPTLEQLAGTIGVVMDAAGSTRAALYAWDLATAPTIAFAARWPERVSAIVIISGTARYVGDDGYEGPTSESYAKGLASFAGLWGTHDYGRAVAPSIGGDKDHLEAIARWQRQVGSPRTGQRVLGLGTSFDVRHILPLVQCPVLVLGSASALAPPVSQMQYIADHVADGRLVLYETKDLLPAQPEHLAWLADTVEEFLTGQRQARRIAERLLATVLFTDFVASTDTLARVGDHEWKRRLDQFQSNARAELTRYSGRFVNGTGDGLVATFSTPGQGIHCAHALHTVARRLGVDMRAGLHTGEIERRSEDIAGLAVHIAARVAAMAGGGETLVSSTVKDLVAGSGIAFESRGLHELKGVPDEWRIFAVVGG